MGIHGDDGLRVVRDALKVTETCSTQSQVRCYPRLLADGETPTNTWQKRDGRLEFDCVGRDWFRAFRITIEAFPVSEFDEGDYTTKDWLIVEPRRPRFSPWPMAERWRRRVQWFIVLVVWPAVLLAPLYVPALRS